jgi:hypothetical protein
VPLSVTARPSDGAFVHDVVTIASFQNKIGTDTA